MCHELLNDINFFHLLNRIDEDLAREAQAGGCPSCGGVLHRACYPRKPRGISRWLLGEGYAWRWSFCCSQDGCRRRLTPASVRFLGRRVYLGVVVVLASALQSGATPARLAALSTHLPISARTLAHWCQWWREVFVTTRFWLSARGHLASALLPAQLPGALLARFAEPLAEALVALLRFVSPVTTRPGNTLIEG